MNKKITIIPIIILVLFFIIFNCTMSPVSSGSSGGGVNEKVNNPPSVNLIHNYTGPIPSGTLLPIETIITDPDNDSLTVKWYVNNGYTGISDDFFVFSVYTSETMNLTDRQFNIKVEITDGKAFTTESFDIEVLLPVRIDSLDFGTNTALGDFIAQTGAEYVHNLTLLDLSEESFTNLNGIDLLINLKEVRFGNRDDLSSTDLEPLSNCYSLKTLEWLVMSGDFDASCLTAFNDCSTLRKLSLSYSGLNYGDAVIISGLTQLTHLILSSNPTLIDETGQAPVAGLFSNLTELEKLDLYNTQITEITQLSSCLKLESLNIKNTNVSEVDKNSLQILLPQCNIVW